MVPRRRARPRVIELVGPAGSGKSTLAQDLCSRNVELRGPISMWGKFTSFIYFIIIFYELVIERL